jgi:hypothetical protein
MLEKIGDLAESVAAGVGVSRRGFLGWAGRGALAVAGVLAAAAIAKAHQPPTILCCGPTGRRCPVGYVCVNCECARVKR